MFITDNHIYIPTIVNCPEILLSDDQICDAFFVALRVVGKFVARQVFLFEWK